MDGVATYTDPTGSFIANIISKNDRNEVQIFPINKNSEEIILSTPSKTIELPLEHSILSVTWVEASEPAEEASPSKKRGKRSKPETSTTKLPEESTSVKLVVQVESGDLFVFAPYSNEIISTITPSQSLKSITSSLKNYSVFGFNEEGQILEISLQDNETHKTFNFKNEQAVSLIKPVNFKGNGSTNKSKNVLLASHDLFLIDLTRNNKKSVIADFPKYEDESNIVKFIQQSKLKSDYVYVAREGSDRIFTYNLSDPKVYSTFKASTSNIFNLQVVSDYETLQEFVLAFTENGVEIFHSDFDIQHEDQPLVSLVKTSFHDSFEPILFTNAFYVNSTLVGIWHKKNQPQFNIIEWEPKSAGEIVVSIDYNGDKESINNINGNDEEEVFDFQNKSIEINNLSAEELVEELTSLLSQDKIDTEKVIQLCASNDDESNIKEAVQSLGALNSPATINNLFEIVSKDISANPSKESSLSIWLKWVLITRGGFISKQSSQKKNLKNLKTNLDEGMKLLPRLLALQGRLQLLKSQAELRNKMVSYSENDDPEIDDTFNESFVNGTTVAEESIVFANGENDDFEEIEKEEGSDAEIVQEDDDFDEAD